ncbi:MAG TPA: hypothetical protein VHN20_12145 [Beijerinckiaceae bacterium]|nr:hypothetical protein [Beijerinckiaceae bacterium]
MAATPPEMGGRLTRLDADRKTLWLRGNRGWHAGLELGTGREKPRGDLRVIARIRRFGSSDPSSAAAIPPAV